MSRHKKNTIGIIEGTGTGQEVAEIFRHVIHAIGGTNTSFLSFKEMYGYLPHSFLGLSKQYYKKRYSLLRKRIEKEEKDLKTFCMAARSKTSGVFRTAINAETLYYLRRDISSIKVSVLPIRINGKKRRIFFVRDQMQGYYTNDDLACARGMIKGSFHYSGKKFVTIANFVSGLIRRHKVLSCDLYFLYKFHLFGFELQRMIEKAVQKTRLDDLCRIAVFQPDTGIHKLLHDFPAPSNSKDLIVVVGNEIGDALLETLIHYYDLGTKETFYTLNYAFADKKDKLEVLQTMHGSADDISQMNILNPIATLNAAGYALENWLGILNAQSRMEHLTKEAYQKIYLHPAIKKTNNTAKTVEYVLSRWKTNGRR